MATNYLKSLLGEDELENVQKQAMQSGLLTAGLQMLASSGRSYTPPSVGAGLGMAGMAGLQGYQGAMQGAEQQALRGMEFEDIQRQRQEQEEFQQAAQQLVRDGRLDHTAAMELATRFPKQSAEVLNAIKLATPPAPAAPKTSVKEIYDNEGRKRFALINESTGDILREIGGAAAAEQKTVIDPMTDAFMETRYGTRNFSQLTPDQKVTVLQFANQPNAEKAASVGISAEQAGYEMPGGIQTPVPAGRQSFLEMVPSEPKQKTNTYMGLPPEKLAQPLKQNEVPLIQSAGISAKNKETLMMNQPQETNALEYTVDNLRQMRNSAEAVLNHPKMQQAFGFGGTTLSKIPGTAAADVRALLDPLKNQSFVSGLQAMRQASPTGGAVGNVSNAEGARFENLIRSLDQAQTPAQVKQSLEKIMEFMDQAEERVRNAYGRTYGSVPDLKVRPVEQVGRRGLDEIFRR
jgi:hypothetical protein